MKTILKIAKTELRVLFYSPIAWFLLVVFFIQCAITYLGLLEQVTKQQEMGGMYMYFMQPLTETIFTGNSGLFWDVMSKLYLYVPLLTMGLISRETSSGTIKLLYSSPVRISGIVLGKYLAMMIYSLLMVAIVGVFTIAGQFHIQYADTGMLMSALLGFYLLLCAYSAIGIFMSGLTTYQVVAAISTFVAIGALSYIGQIGQKYEFVRTITYFLSLSGRAENILMGLITSRDVIYFLIIIFIFLGCTVYKLKAGMESKPAWVRVGRYASVIVIAMIVGYVSSRHSLIAYYDATANKKMTIAPREQEITKTLSDAPLEVTAYTNLIDNFHFFGMPEGRNADLSRWEPYMRFNDKIKLKYVMYYDSTFDQGVMSGYPGKSVKEIAEIYAKNEDVNLKKVLTPAEMRKQIDLRPENYRYVMHLKYKNKSTFLRVFNDQMMWPSGTEVAAAFNRLLETKLPKIVFVTGNLERDVNKAGDRDYKIITSDKTFRYAFINQGFDIDTLSLEERDIPADAAAVVLADPKIALPPATLARLQEYIRQGGNLLIAAEPGKQEILNPLLKELGIQMLNGVIIQSSKELEPDLALPLITEKAAGFSKALLNEWSDTTGINMGMVSRKVSMRGATGFTYGDTSAFHIAPLLETDSALSWLKKDKLVADSGDVVFNAANGDEKRSFPLALSLTRQINGKEQRIIVAGDADFMSNAELQRYNVKTANFTFNTALYSWLCYNKFPIDSSRPKDKDMRSNVSLDSLDYLRILFIWVLPGLLTIFAAVLLIRRKRK